MGIKWSSEETNKLVKGLAAGKPLSKLVKLFPDRFKNLVGRKVRRVGSN